ncbi:alpha/beta fold hydrolase [Nocardia sp. SYP-A9097]|uniref:alpha/beta fold hydrolase n=1 Tax=Nocardia sp. SYP-A9097 TaxID=2663237 RepID=UPI00129BF29C|nr:alpha/beta hydrolase [Nocardia sp. SYP-A9097]MRH90174.1 alpha/beta fold hydrolase [Nocardia sp. SYP-A9097]
MTSADHAESTLELRRDGLLLSARHFGAADAPLVMLLHGFPDTPHSWDGVIPLLVDAGFQVLTPWLRGYTLDSAARTARYDLIAVADDIAAWHRALGGPPTHLVGHDWGAFAAMIQAKRQPRQWLSLTLLAIPPFGGGFAPAAARHLPRQTLMSSYIPLMQSAASPHLLTRDNAAFVRRLWHRWSPDWDFTDTDFAPTARVFTHHGTAWAATRYYRSLFTVHRAPTRRFHRLLLASPAALPTLALSGQHDGCMSPALQRILAERAGTLAAQIPGTGHFLHAEDPTATAAHLIPHLHAHSR